MTDYAHNANDLSPLMTANNAPSPLVLSVSSEYNSSYMAYKAFDHAGGSGWFTTSGVATGWIQIYSGGPLWQVTSYTICTPVSTVIACPKDFILYGSFDGSNWTQLDSRTNETSWGASEMRTYSIASPGNYKYYKLSISAINGGTYAGVGELELIGTVVTMQIPSCYFLSNRDRFNLEPVSKYNQLA